MCLCGEVVRLLELRSFVGGWWRGVAMGNEGRNFSWRVWYVVVDLLFYVRFGGGG